MILLIILFLIVISLVFTYFFLKLQDVNREIDELYDMYYEIHTPRNEKKGKITVLNRKVGK